MFSSRSQAPPLLCPFGFNLTWVLAPACRSWMGQRTPRVVTGLETMAGGTAAEDAVRAAEAMGLTGVETPVATVTAAMETAARLEAMLLGAIRVEATQAQAAPALGTWAEAALAEIA
jgi:hypothetical protein